MTNNYSKFYTIFVLLVCSLTSPALLAQVRFVGVDQLKISGKIPHTGPILHRVDTSQHQDLPENIKKLMTHSSGMHILFRTDSRQISAKWCTTQAKTYANLPAIAFEGVDLYIKRDGKWQYAGIGRPGGGAKDSRDCQTATLVQDMDSGMKECLLYLPLYDETLDIQIGIDSTAQFASLTPQQAAFSDKKIIIYGTSIVQGASASRPGLSYPSKISRDLGIEIVNWGVSGSAKMEKSVSRLIGETQMDLLIIDCVPNCSPEHLRERTASFIQEIRKQHPRLPIIAIEGAPFESGNFNTVIAQNLQNRNLEFSKSLKQLMKSDPHLFLLDSQDLMGHDHEGTIDGTHPNDLGFARMVAKIKPFLENLIKQYGIL